MSQLFREFITVALGGALGSVSRFALSSWVQGISANRHFPWGILAVNVLGCFVIGVLYGLLVHRFVVGPVWRAGLFIGILGGFTTFSSFSLDTMNLLQVGQYVPAGMNVLLSVVLGLLASALGLWLTHQL